MQDSPEFGGLYLLSQHLAGGTWGNMKELSIQFKTQS